MTLCAHDWGMRVESEHAERLRTVLAGQPAPRRGPRRALLEPLDGDDLPTVRRVVQVPLRPVLPPKGPPSLSPVSAVSVVNGVLPLVREPVPEEADDDAGDEPGSDDAQRPTAVARVRAFTLRHLQAIGILVVVALVFTAVQLLRAKPSEIPLLEPMISAEASSVPPEVTPSAVVMLLVHVTGAVKNPGVVQVPQGARVNDAIAAAGGITPAAHLGSLNLAAPVTDGMQILVASGPEQTSTTSGDAGTQQPPGESGGALVNLNTATQAQLESLPGVGPATAEKILAWRDQHGKFTKVEELQEIDGIGQKTFDRLKPLVTV